MLGLGRLAAAPSSPLPPADGAASQREVSSGRSQQLELVAREIPGKCKGIKITTKTVITPVQGHGVCILGNIKKSSGRGLEQPEVTEARPMAGTSWFW